jgi:hypothetical protein
MGHLNVEHILYQSDEPAVCTTFEEPLTCEQYRQRIDAGIEQCEKGESSSLEDFSTALGYRYADL